MEKLQIMNRNNRQTENVLHYSSKDTVADVYDMIRRHRGFGPDTQIVLVNISGLNQNGTPAELQSSEPIRKYFPRGGKVYLETQKTPINSKQEQNDLRLHGNEATREAQQKNIIAVQSDNTKAEVADCKADDKAKQGNLIVQGPTKDLNLAGMMSF